MLCFNKLIEVVNVKDGFCLIKKMKSKEIDISDMKMAHRNLPPSDLEIEVLISQPSTKEI